MVLFDAKCRNTCYKIWFCFNAFC
jgi:hypothetical protein